AMPGLLARKSAFILLKRAFLRKDESVVDKRIEFAAQTRGRGRHEFRTSSFGAPSAEGVTRGEKTKAIPIDGMAFVR
ncbi:MAG TPA: hypothetical protein PKO22_07040, partial [Treponemataceae bacterium]|nr:hypothetical protein [Treponemataceae bacterium]